MNGQENEIMDFSEIIEMAKQAGFHEHDFPFKKFKFEAFAKLVAAKKQEQCAQFCEEQYEFYGYDHVFAAGIRALK